MDTREGVRMFGGRTDAAFTAFVTEWQQRLYRQAYLLCGERQAAQDLRPVPLTDDELVAMGSTSEFRDLVRLGIEYAATRPATDGWVLMGKDGEKTRGTVPRPTWPRE